MSFYFLVVLFVTFAASGLQYSVLGSVWPIVYRDFGVALSWIGYINMIIAAGRVTASIYTDRLVGRYGTYRVAACGFGLICLGLFGYANCGSYAVLCLSSIPLGIGEDLFLCAINTFSALHLRAKNANWLNMVWSLGATAGPYIMHICLNRGAGWNAGYFVLTVLQFGALLLFLSSRARWREIPSARVSPMGTKRKPMREAIRLKGMPAMLAALFCYTAIETTSALWAGSYITLQKGLPDSAGALGTTCLFFGMTLGRFMSGFISDRMGDRRMMRIGQALITAGGLTLLLFSGEAAALVSMAVLGFGCAPIFPSFIHYVPHVFGNADTGSAVSLLMGGSQIATLLIPIAFGWVADFGGMALYPAFQILFALAMMAALSARKNG